jgi:hypothetical protein
MNAHSNAKNMIDKYKKGELSESEMEQIEEALLQKLAEKRAEDKLRQNLRGIAESLRAETNKAEKDKEKPASPSPLKVAHRQLWVVRATAAAVLLVLLALWWLMSPVNNASLNAPQMALQHLEQENAPILSNSMADDTLSAVEQAARSAYLEKKYAVAVQLFEKLPPTTAAHHFYLGIAALKQEKPDFALAETHLLQARSLGQGWQEDAINWYLALLYLGQKNTSKARQELERIISVGRDNVAKADLLLQKL